MDLLRVTDQLNKCLARTRGEAGIGWNDFPQHRQLTQHHVAETHPEISNVKDASNVVTWYH
jgi:hypothetical protein